MGDNGAMTVVTDTGAFLPLDYTGFLFRRAQQLHVAAWQRHVSATVSSVQFGVLAVLDRRPGASQQELCEALDLDRSTIADLVRRLERNGLVERRRDDTDRRRNRLELTDDGARTLAQLRPRAETVEHALTDALSTEERGILRTILLRVLAADQPPGTGGSSTTSRSSE